MITRGLLFLTPPAELGRFLRFLEQVLEFWLAVAFDWVLTYSLVFAFGYGIYLAVGAVLPKRPTPRTAAMPFLAVLVLLFQLLTNDVLAGALAPRFLDLCGWLSLEGLPTIGSWLWLIGMVAAGIGLARKVRACRRLHLVLPNAENDPAFRRALQESGLTAEIPHKRLEKGAEAVSWGVFHPFVATSADFRQRRSEDERYCIYRHELLHLQRCDALGGLAAALFATVFWFNPAAHWAARRYRNHVEIARDRATLQLTKTTPDRYAELIVGSMERWEGLANGFSGGYRAIHNRLGHIFKDDEMLRKARLGLPAALAIFLLAAAVSTYVTTVRQPEPIDPPLFDTSQIPGYPGEPVILRWRNVRYGILGMYGMITKTEAEDRH